MNVFLSLFAKLPLPILRAFAGLVAIILFNLKHIRIRQTVHINFALIYPHLSAQERASLEYKNILNQCYTAVESIKVWGSSPDYSLKQIRNIYGLELLTAAFAKQKGVILVVPHLGTWEIMNAWINQFGAPTIMYKPAKSKNVDQFMLQARQRLKSTLVPTDESGVRAIFKTLKQGGFTAILPDHVPDSSSGGVYAPFFGHMVLTTTLVSKLAQKTQCVVIGLSCIRCPNHDGFDIYCSQVPDDIYSTDLALSAATLNQHMVHMIEPHITDYVWSYRRFKAAKHFNAVYNSNMQRIEQIANNKNIDNFV